MVGLEISESSNSSYSFFHWYLPLSFSKVSTRVEKHPKFPQPLDRKQKLWHIVEVLRSSAVPQQKR